MLLICRFFAAFFPKTIVTPVFLEGEGVTEVDRWSEFFQLSVPSLSAPLYVPMNRINPDPCSEIV